MADEFGFHQQNPLGASAHVPSNVRAVYIALMVLGLLKAMLLVFVLYLVVVGGWEGVDPIGRAMACVFIPFLTYCATCAIAAAVLLSRGNPRGRTLAWMVLPITLLGFPLLTALSIVIIIQLRSPEMENFLRQVAPAPTQ